MGEGGGDGGACEQAASRGHIAWDAHYMIRPARAVGGPVAADVVYGAVDLRFRAECAAGGKGKTLSELRGRTRGGGTARSGEREGGADGDGDEFEGHALRCTPASLDLSRRIAKARNPNT